MILSGRFGDPYGRAGDRRRIRESWHVCLRELYYKIRINCGVCQKIEFLQIT